MLNCSLYFILLIPFVFGENLIYMKKHQPCNHPPSTWCTSYEIAQTCQVVQQCQNWHSNSVKPVNFALYAESLCPGCKKFFSTQLYPTWKKLNNSDIFNVSVYPYGNAKEHINGHRWIFECQHGPEECVGNQIMTCAIAILRDTNRWLPYLACIEESSNRTNMVQVATACAKSQGIDYEPIDVCSHNEWGDMLEHHVAVQTEALNPPHKYVPWVTLNGVHNDDIQNRSMSNLLKLICDTYQGAKPHACPSTLFSRCYQNN